MSIYRNLAPIDLEQINTYELASRTSKVTVKDFSRPLQENDSLKDFLDKLPDILAVKSLRGVAERVRRAWPRVPFLWLAFERGGGQDYPYLPESLSDHARLFGRLALQLHFARARTAAPRPTRRRAAAGCRPAACASPT